MGQGALAVECRIGDDRVIKILNELNHKETVLSVIAERAFMRKLVSKILERPFKITWNVERAVGLHLHFIRGSCGGGELNLHFKMFRVNMKSC